MSSEVDAILAGQTTAAKVIAQIRSGVSLPDLLHASLQDLRAAGNGEALRAFTRQVQKALEGQR